MLNPPLRGKRQDEGNGVLKIDIPNMMPYFF